MQHKVEEYMKKHQMIHKEDTVIVGVSGGSDSVCLLYMLLEYKKSIPFHIAVVHVNHKVRLDASIDADYVKSLCEKHELPFFLYVYDIKEYAKKNKISEEEAGRECRYQAFYDVAKKLNQKEYKIAVAHHKQDLAETVLFRLFRGTGLKGIRGILPVRDHIIRPLLEVGKEEIEEYLTKMEISWCIDSTNAENTYTRNKIRNQLIPYIEKEINNKSVNHIVEFSEKANDIYFFLNKYIEQKFAELSHFEENGVVFCIDYLRKEEKIIIEGLLMKGIEHLLLSNKDINGTHINCIVDLLGKEGNKQLDLPNNLVVKKEYEKLVLKERKVLLEEQKIEEKRFLKSQIEKEHKIKFELEKKIIEISLIELTEEKYKECFIENTYTKCFDYDKIKNYLIFRFKQEGDYLTINNLFQKKSLKKYFINEKIKDEERKKILLLAECDHVIWVIGKRISTYYKVSDKTKKILKVSVREEN